MKITEALRIVQRADATAAPYRVVLACGFTPLHLQTFLAARLQERLPDRRVTIQTGLYGDLTGTVNSIRPGEVDAVAVTLEWFDADPRLGYRGEGKWGPSVVADVVVSAQKGLERLAGSIHEVPAEVPIAILLPTLPMTPVFHVPGDRVSEAELELEQALLTFSKSVARRSGCGLVHRERLGEESGSSGRFDLKADLLTGLPYTIVHADSVALALARLLAPDPPKKGLITDLDDTLWRGIVGEIGVEGISWDLAGHSQLHGLYQQLLQSLAEEGVLIAAASKNDPAVVQRAFQRGDLRVHPEGIFPVEVSWNAKSAAVGRILRKWNVGAESVIFVDDSPMELAEVTAVHPGIEGVLFPKDDYTAGYALLRRLRDWFGKPRVSQEDRLRLNSIRNSAAFREGSPGGDVTEEFLEQSDAVITMDWHAVDDPRMLELVNKTNQFNLNGVRFTAVEWRDRVAHPDAWLATVSYEDKFGPLGKIAVMQGRLQDEAKLRVETWVMSCRAFSRRIEHQCLRRLFERYQPSQIGLDFKETAKNGPFQNFFTSLIGAKPAAGWVITRLQFDERCPALYHRVVTTAEAAVQS